MLAVNLVLANSHFNPTMSAVVAHCKVACGMWHNVEHRLEAACGIDDITCGMWDVDRMWDVDWMWDARWKMWGVQRASGTITT